MNCLLFGVFISPRLLLCCYARLWSLGVFTWVSQLWRRAVFGEWRRHKTISDKKNGPVGLENAPNSRQPTAGPHRGPCYCLQNLRVFIRTSVRAFTALGAASQRLERTRGEWSSRPSVCVQSKGSFVQPSQCQAFSSLAASLSPPAV